MRLLQIRNLKIELIDGTTLVDRVNLDVNEGNIIGLIGDNGSGKTTLLKAIASESNYEGLIERYTPIGLLQQFSIDITQPSTIYDYLSIRSDDWWDITEKYAEVFHEELEADKYAQELSSGELQKIDIAIILSSNAELFLFDEPTNHLDIDSKSKFIDYIKKSGETFIISSHDIDFLDQVATDIWAINGNTIEAFYGNYTEYIEFTKTRSAKKEVLYKVETQRIDRLKKVMMEKETQAKITHIKVHRDPYLKKKVGKKSHQAKVAKDKISKLVATRLSELETIPKKDAYLNLNHEEIVTNNLITSFKNQQLIADQNILIKSLNLDIYSTDRICINGKNGSGKTSLLKLIIKSLTNKNIAYLSQKYELVNRSKTVMENINSLGIEKGYSDIRKALGNFNFDDTYLNKKASELSGGEICKLCFAMISISNIDILILDEPTNNLDVRTINTIIRALNNYKSTLIVVSHNQNFLNQIDINKEYLIEDRELVYKED
jgi:ATPase subunit of ABC transporter with duplicated ATPase domains